MSSTPAHQDPSPSGAVDAAPVGDPTTRPAPTAHGAGSANGAVGAPRRDLAQFVVVAVLVALGAFVLADTWDVVPGMEQADPLGPRAFPLVVGVGLLLLAALLAIVTLRGSRGDIEGGEDVDLEKGSDWRTVAALVGVFALNIALVDVLGWAITGALLFAGCAAVLGSRTHVRDLLVGVVLSVASFYGFYVGLGVPVPAGVLDGIL